MLEVKVYMVPFGIREAQEEISSIRIWNKGNGNIEIGHYGYEITDSKGLKIEGNMDGFSRGEGALNLIKKILNDAL